jgi:ABC-2 type transport system ATP-binding protein
MDYMIKTEGLIKRYGDVTALDGLDLVVPQGTILGLLGPNGAGKTTAVRILTTLLEFDEGSAEVAGLDVRTQPDEVRRRIGLSGQNVAVDEHLTGFENLDMVGRLYHLGRTSSRSRARELLDQFELSEAGDRPAKTYSGGMRRRLDLAAALVANPDVLFLDEPTTGLDPRSRIQMWQTIQELVSIGSTVLLTTQYMEEADRLADDILVVDRGRGIAHGTPDQLKTQLGGERVEAVLAESADLAPAQTILAGLCLGDVRVEEQDRSLTAAVTNGASVLQQVLLRFAGANIHVVDIGLRRPTLDDVFLTLTGHAAEDGDPASSDDSKDGSQDARQKEAVR